MRFDGSTDIDLPNGTTSVAGILKLVNDLTTGGTDKALTAEQGKILNAAMFGVGQTWQDLTASRALNTTYTNTTGKTIFVVMSFTVTNNYDLTKIVVGGLELTAPLEYGGGGITPCLSFPVPNNTSYAVNAAYGAVNKWSEFR